MMNNSIILKNFVEELELTVLKDEKAYLLEGMVGTCGGPNNCQCGGNNCQCEANNCQCRGNNCQCFADNCQCQGGNNCSCPSIEN